MIKYLLMKKFFLIIIIFTHIYSAFSQEISGNYYNFFGSRLSLLPDSSYKYIFRFDLSSSWSTGKWKVLNDTIFLVNMPIYDTLIGVDTIWKSKHFNLYTTKQINELYLSTDENPERISLSESIMSSIYGGGQNRVPNPPKLVSKRGKLFKLDETGRLETKKVNGFTTRKKFKTYYIKEK
jgi:hypothetical protein